MKKIFLLLSIVLLASCSGTTDKPQVDDNQSQAGETETQDNSNSEMLSELLENNDYDTMEKTFQTEMPQNGDLIAVMKTNKGTIKIRLFKDLAPQTVFNFAKHAQDGYYDGLIFHRIIKGFMIQGGDPEGNGTGGESIYGPKFEDEFSDNLSNIPGSISMANSGPNTNGSQFFINENNNDYLDNKHSVFGQVYEGYDNVKAIAKVKTADGDKPVNDVKIIEIEVKEYKDGVLNDYKVGTFEEVLDKVSEIQKVLDAEKEKEKLSKIEADKNRVVKAGDKVAINYELKGEDGVKIDSSYDRGEAFVFNVGSTPLQVIPGFDKGVQGMKIGEKKSLVLEPKDAYGEYDEKNVIEVPKKDLAQMGLDPEAIEVGMELFNGMYNVKVLDITDEAVKIDNNSPLAGKKLFFDVEMVEFAN